MKLKLLIENLCKDKKKAVYYLMVILLVGVLLILIGDITTNLLGKNKPRSKNTVEVASNSQSAATAGTYESTIKKELTETLSQMQGVGRVSVMIYFEGGASSVPAFNTNDSNKKTEEKDNQGGTRVTTEITKSQNLLVVNDGSSNKPYIVEEINPKIGGVVVVSDGASDPVIKENITNAVKTVLNIPSNKVSVMPMKK